MDDKDMIIVKLNLALKVAALTIDMLTQVLKRYKDQEEKQLEVCKN